MKSKAAIGLLNLDREGRMNITITKKENRNLLKCVRDDGTSMTAELGPGLPHHDLAHYVIERKLQLTGGFFGKIAEGYTVAQLSDKEIIKTSGAQTLIAEVVARALQSLSSGACTFDQFMELINTELAQWRIAALTIAPDTVTEMSGEFQLLVGRYSALKNGESIELHFPISTASKSDNGWPRTDAQRNDGKVRVGTSGG